MSTEQEVELGRQLSAEVEKKEKLLSDEQVQAYVRDIGWRLAHVSPRQDVQYTFKVVDDPKSVNAFSLPGGYVYVYTGLMKVCKNEAELAAVIAHEVGHVAGRHHGEMYTRLYGYDVLAQLILGKNPSANAKLVAALLGTTGAMYYSREQEREADQVGIELLFRAGYRPEAMLSFMDKMIAEEQKRGGIWLPIFASHPRTEERIARLHQLVQQYPQDMREANLLYAERYQQKVLAVLGSE